MKTMFKHFLWVLFCWFINGFLNDATAQSTFSLKAGFNRTNNPSADGIFAYGYVDKNDLATFTPFEKYGYTNGNGGIDYNNLDSKLITAWYSSSTTFTSSTEGYYPQAGYENLNPNFNISPQPFPTTGIYLHPMGSNSVIANAKDLPVAIKVTIPFSGTASLSGPVGNYAGVDGTGVQVIKVSGGVITPVVNRVLVGPNSQTTVSMASTAVATGDYFLVIVDTGGATVNAGNPYNDDTFLDLNLTVTAAKIQTPVLTGVMDCSATTASVGVQLQNQGTMYLYQVGNAVPIATIPITADGYNGIANFSGLNLSAGGNYYFVAKNAGQIDSDPSSTITFAACCTTPAIPIITADNSVLCGSGDVHLAVTNCSGLLTWEDNSTGTQRTVSPSTTTTYTATCSSGTPTATASCSSQGSKTIVVNSLANAPVSLGDKTICQGDNLPILSVTVSNNETVDWYNAPSGGDALINSSATYSPNRAITATYYAQTRNTILGCVSATRTPVTLTVNPLPTIVELSSACAADLKTYSVNFSSDFAVKTSLGTILGSVVSGIPAKTNAILSSTSTMGCTATLPITAPICDCPMINPPISGGNQTICDGMQLPILSVNVSSGESVDWYDAATNGNLLVENSNFCTPTSAGTYYAQTRNNVNNCVSATRTAVSLTINHTPILPIIIADKSPIILGESTVLRVTNCDGKVTWQDGSLGTTLAVSPSLSSTYFATCIGKGGCVSGVAQFSVKVSPPSVSIKTQNACAGQNVVLSQVGCPATYAWTYYTGNWQDGNAKSVFEAKDLKFTLTQTTHFRLTCSTSAGESYAETTLSPYALPHNPILKTDKSFSYSGEAISIIDSGCDGFLVWSNGEQGYANSKRSITVNPEKSATYWAICYGSHDCGSDKVYINLEVKTPPPAIKDLTVCYGDTLKLNSLCNGNAGVFWENWQNGSPNVFKDGEIIVLTSPHTYAVHCEGVAGLSDEVIVRIQPKNKVEKPTLSGIATIIKGDSTQLVANGLVANGLVANGLVANGLVANGCHTTEWRTSKSSWQQDTNAVWVKPVKTTNYQVRCLEDGCRSDWAEFTVKVRPKNPLLYSPADTICADGSTNISTNGCEDNGQLVWLNDSRLGGNLLSIAPKKDTLFRAVCVQRDSLSGESLVSDTSKISIVVIQLPMPPQIVAEKASMVQGESTTLTAKDCQGKVIWLGATTNENTFGETKIVQPLETTTYVAACWLGNCHCGDAEFTVTVRPKQPEIVIHSNAIDNSSNDKTGKILSDTICVGKTLSLSAQNCKGTIHWNDGMSEQIGSEISVTGKQDLIYSVYCVDAHNEKSDNSSVSIFVRDYNINDVIVYPNPTTDKIYIKSRGCVDGVTLKLYTTSGQLLYEGKGQEHYLDSLVLDLSDLPSQQYILQILGDDGGKSVVIARRIVKINQ